MTPNMSNTPTAAGFQVWVVGFKQRAREQGISERTLDSAFRGVTLDPAIIARDQNQSEFTKQLWEYLDSAASETRIANGQAMMRKHGQVLAQLQATYGVDAEVVVAIWGLESAYGSNRGSTPIIGALATMAYEGRRGAFFEEQLIAALKILQNGDVTPQGMTGSWAGAMGHTQFIPTSYLSYAVDFGGDGKRDIWSDDPTDALASTAAYLAESGWQSGHPWGVEVRVPSGFDFAQSGHDTRKTVTEWTQLGVRDMAGNTVRNYGDAAILFPAGAQGPAFMIFRNFNVIERYNAADSYVIAVGHLSDRIKGGSNFQGSWPRSDRALKRDERVEIQERLTAKGFSTQGVDGRIGPNTIAAIREFQLAAGMVPDGYPSVSLLQKLR
nr:lytic murein transglycosylase [Pseudoruegeria sp. SK021]